MRSTVILSNEREKKPNKNVNTDGEMNPLGVRFILIGELAKTNSSFLVGYIIVGFIIHSSS